MIPVAISMEFWLGDAILTVFCLGTGLVYGLGRRFVR